MSQLLIYQSDKNFDVQFTVLREEDGQPKDLSGYTVYFKMWAVNAPAVILVDTLCSITDATNGVCEFTAPDKFNALGFYRGEVELTKVSTDERSSSLWIDVRVKESG